jgi:hypothetical protein
MLPLIGQAERHVAHRAQSLERTIGGEVDPRFSESAVEKPLDQERQGSHKNVRFDPRLDWMVDRSHRQHVLELAVSLFDLRKFLV